MSKPFRTTVTMTIYREIEIEVDVTRYPEEKEVRYYPDGSGYPGSPAEIVVNDITPGSLEIDLTEEERDELESLVEDELADME